MSLDRWAAAALGCAVAACTLIPVRASAQAAPASVPTPASAEMTPAERAQRDADKVFRWILINGERARKPGAAREDKPAAVATRPKAARAPARADEPAVETAAAAAPSAPASAVALPPVAAESAPLDVVAAPPDSKVAAVTIEASPPPATTPAAVAAQAVDEALTPLTRRDPEFPPALIRSLRKGDVRVRFTVLPDGSVAEPAVVTSSNARLNSAALTAIAQWRFVPLRHAQSGVVDLGFNLD